MKNKKEKYFTIVFPDEKGFKYDEIRYPAGEWQMRLKNLEDMRYDWFNQFQIRIGCRVFRGESRSAILQWAMEKP